MPVAQMPVKELARGRGEMAAKKKGNANAITKEAQEHAGELFRLLLEHPQEVGPIVVQFLKGVDQAMSGGDQKPQEAPTAPAGPAKTPAPPAPGPPPSGVPAVPPAVPSGAVR